uniref:Integral membrane protein DGCR2/IDD n=1 Tax=Culex pipiens TaxID=7175 RepID=A0A8D8FXN0_CULPI
MYHFPIPFSISMLQKDYQKIWFVHCIWILSIVKESAGAFGSVVSLPGECRDVNGKKVEQDAHYVPPGSDVCRLCLCDNGLPKACKAVLCTPPHDCKSFQLGASCCEFICLDDTLTINSDKSYDFGM